MSISLKLIHFPTSNYAHRNLQSILSRKRSTHMGRLYSSENMLLPWAPICLPHICNIIIRIALNMLNRGVLARRSTGQKTGAPLYKMLICAPENYDLAPQQFPSPLISMLFITIANMLHCIRNDSTLKNGERESSSCILLRPWCAHWWPVQIFSSVRPWRPNKEFDKTTYVKY